MTQATGRSLLALQAVDQRLSASRRELAELTSQLEAQAEIPQLREQAEAEHAESLERRAALTRLDTNVEALRDRVRSLEERIYGGSVTNLRELTAVEEEQTVARRELAQAEEALGPARYAAEESEHRYTDLIRTLEERERTWTETEPVLREQIATLEQEVQELERERADAAEGIPDNELRLYDQLLFRRKGVAVAHVERGVCQACHIALPLRESARLRRANTLVTCGNCGRILIST